MPALIARRRTGAALLALTMSFAGPACVFDADDDDDAEVEPIEEEEEDAEVETEVEVEDEATP